LAIARAIVQDKHGGELAFKTSAGVGTTFSIRLPIEGHPTTAG
jgi:signal transduction histidine kinase